MKLIFFFVFVCFIDSARATNYYFSAGSGNDSRTSTQAKNPSTPWKTISKLNSFFSNLKPGDQVLFKRGETFYGSITLGRSGKAGSPIVIGAYGTGEKPVITSLVKLSGWKANPKYKGVYDCAANSQLGSDVNIVLLNNVFQHMGRYPNSNAVNKGYLEFESHQGKASFTDKQLSSSPNWTGAEAVIRTRKWIIDRSVIKSHSKNKIYLSPKEITYGLLDGFGYFIQDHIKTLDQFGEWYYNPSKKVVSVYFGAKKPFSYDIRASAVNNLIYSKSKSYVVIENLTLKGANKFGVDINGGNNITVKNCDILFSGTDGVNASKNSFFKLENCSVFHSNNNGVNTNGSAHATVRNNIIKNSYAVPGMGQSGNGQGIGIRIGSNSIAEYNQVINSGYTAIVYTGNDLVIKNNFIDTFSFVKDDGGAIYTSNGPNITNRGRKITGNIILNGLGAPGGTTSGSSTSSADGIYMDDNVNGTEITGNTIANTNRGIYLHNSRNIVVKNNTSYNNKMGQLYMKHDWLGEKIRKQTITNNIFFSRTATQTAASIATVLDDNDISNMGKFDNNYYARPIDDKLVFFVTTFYNSGKEYRKNLHLEGWKSKYRLDASSKRSAKKIAPYGVPVLIGANKYPEGSFKTRTDVKHIWANYCSLTMGNSGVLDAGYLKVVPSKAKSSIVLYVGPLSSSKQYILNYSLKGSGNMSIETYLRTSDYNPLTAPQLRAVSTNRSENQLIFTPSANEKSNGAIVFTVDAKSTYYLDNIQLYEAKSKITNPNDSIRFVYNPAKVNKTVRLDGQYVDVKNNKFSNSIVLEPYASAVLIKTTRTSAKNTAPTVSITNPGANAGFTTPASIKISAEATDEDGTISKVAFYNGSKLLETKYSAPYTFTWNNVKKGKYTLTAKATDNDGLVAASKKVSLTVSVYNLAKPTVNITTPTSNDRFSKKATIKISANAADNDGTISKVEFYSGSRLLDTEVKRPYLYSWKNVPAGNYTITAKAIDDDGNVTTSAGVSISVGSGSSKRAPTVRLTNPDNNTTYPSRSNIYMRALANSASGTLKKVSFYSGNRLLSTQYAYPYAITWRDVAVGTYTLKAVATDNNGLSATSAPVKVTVVNKSKSLISSRPSSESTTTDSDSLTGKTDLSDNTASLRVSPNPVRTTLNISTKGLSQNKPLTISVVSAAGSVIKTIQSNTSNQIVQLDVSSWQSGVYFIKVICGGKLLSQQFIKL